VTRQVWVPNLVQKPITCTVMRPQMFAEKYTYLVNLCRAEQRTQTCNVVDMVPEQQTRQVPYTVCVPKTQTVTVNQPQWSDEPYSYVVTLCRPEVRTQTCNVVDMVPEQQSRQVSDVVCVPKVETRQRQVTVLKCVPVQQTQTYQVPVPYTVAKMVPTTVCRMVPKTIQCYMPVPAAPACGPVGCAQ
jgi:hypothetical protein